MHGRSGPRAPHEPPSAPPRGDRDRGLRGGPGNLRELDLGLPHAYARSQGPPDVAGTPMFLLGLAGLAANLVMLLLLRGWARTNINARGAFLHAYGDTLGAAGGGAAAAPLPTPA